MAARIWMLLTALVLSATSLVGLELRLRVVEEQASGVEDDKGRAVFLDHIGNGAEAQDEGREQNARRSQDHAQDRRGENDGVEGGGVGVALLFFA